ncbi:TIGR03086 family protein [Frankia sp. CNm7]|uniref:TIGR03086 family protein n=1 Tax=Frankia nepalensis TaxID=1836974 RepID=A0A937RIF8_9ACTN|nr:TIGR03086 family metal-binding protein [Frankia nepalensis]MBL7498951.1 TIGR03086 family protein [Frankia nepalensis]MBL7511252.1 TIGR03086 family protein [Frankia nepalensis]MBL7520574.1 TIGR03086 family protein [Frankia nepalensis]MBL7630772.1 TIGR03086 family protein [Frankia nepalensis]
MSDAKILLHAAAAPLPEIIDSIGPHRLGAATPCAGFDLRGLVNHLLFWGPSLAGAGRKEVVPPPAESETAVDLTAEDWASDLKGQVERLVGAWSEPDAWEGVTRMGGAMELPAELVAGMVVGELVVHGWDLARAVGRRPSWDGDVLEYLYGEIARSAELGREMGVYGPEIPVPAGAPMLDRVLGLSGRDPAWAPKAS